MFSGLGPGEIIGILVVFLLLFGARKLPELARSLGQSLKEFRKAQREVMDEITDADRPAKPSEGSPPQPSNKPPAGPA